MTAFEVGGFFGLAAGAVAGAIVCHSHGVLAIIGGVVGRGIVGLIAGVLFGALMVVLCGLWYLITGRLKPDGSLKEKAHDRDNAA